MVCGLGKISHPSVSHLKEYYCRRGNVGTKAALYCVQLRSKQQKYVIEVQKHRCHIENLLIILVGKQG